MVDEGFVTVGSILLCSAQVWHV